MSTSFARIRDLQRALDAGETTAVALTELALSRITDPKGEGAAAFMSVYQDQALAAARASDILRAAGLSRSALEGIPISIKDLFDYKGDVTRSSYQRHTGRSPPRSRCCHYWSYQHDRVCFFWIRN